MGLDLAALPVPLRTDDSGTVRVGGTRVTLDVVVGFYEEGCSADEIAHRLPSVKLCDVYAVLAFYLGHRSQVQAYLAERAKTADHWRQVWEKRCPPDELRRRLLARRAEKTPST